MQQGPAEMSFSKAGKAPHGMLEWRMRQRLRLFFM
jgi:hypothetical protein